MFRRLVASLVCLAFIFSNSPYIHAQEFSIDLLPAPGSMVSITSAYVPLTLKGLIIHPENALKFDFLMDTGHSHLKGAGLSDEALKIMKYFLTALTIPEDDLWVNLSPYEKDRIVQDNFGQTIMGRDLLAQDYILKQLTASLIYPEKTIGKEFWQQVYSKAAKEFGTTQIPVNTFNKVWIVPSEAVVWEHDGKVLIVKSRLKVMLEEDYLSLLKHGAVGNLDKTHSLASQIVRSVVLPVLEKEVNEGKNFAQLRQMYQAMILATWYKKALKESILNRVYTDKKKTAGIGYSNPADIESIYQQYLKAFKKGAFNYIKEDQIPNCFNPVSGCQTVARKYFSGGVTLRAHGVTDLDTGVTVLKDAAPPAFAQTTGTMIDATWQLAEQNSNAAMSGLSSLFFFKIADNKKPSGEIPSRAQEFVDQMIRLVGRENNQRRQQARQGLEVMYPKSKPFSIGLKILRFRGSSDDDCLWAINWLVESNSKEALDALINYNDPDYRPIVMDAKEHAENILAKRFGVTLPGSNKPPDELFQETLSALKNTDLRTDGSKIRYLIYKLSKMDDARAIAPIAEYLDKAYNDEAARVALERIAKDSPDRICQIGSSVLPMHQYAVPDSTFVWALNLLAKAGNKEALALVIKFYFPGYYTDTVPGARRQARNILRKKISQEALNSLESAYPDEYNKLLPLISALNESAEQPAINAILEHLNTSSPAVQGSIRDSLEGSLESSDLAYTLASSILKLPASAPANYIWALNILAETDFKKSFDAMLKFSDPDHRDEVIDAQKAALKILGEKIGRHLDGPERIEAVLLKFLAALNTLEISLQGGENINKELKTTIGYLGNIRDERALEPILKWRHFSFYDPTSRREDTIVAALKNIIADSPSLNYQVGVELLLTPSEDTSLDPDERFQRYKFAIDILVETGRPEALAAIMNFSGSGPIAGIQKQAIATLRKKLGMEIPNAQEPASSAMAHPLTAATNPDSELGGIALNSKLMSLQIKRDGNGVPLPISQQPLDQINIQGFVPQIISIKPIDLPVLLGLNSSKERPS